MLNIIKICSGFCCGCCGKGGCSVRCLVLWLLGTAWRAVLFARVLRMSEFLLAGGIQVFSIQLN